MIEDYFLHQSIINNDNNNLELRQLRNPYAPCLGSDCKHLRVLFASVPRQIGMRDKEESRLREETYYTHCHANHVVTGNPIRLFTSSSK